MKCTCEQARREARAEAFEEAAKLCETDDGTTAGVSHYYARKFRLIAEAERATLKPRVLSIVDPKTGRASGWQPFPVSTSFSQAMRAATLTAKAIDRIAAEKVKVAPIIESYVWTTEYTTEDGWVNKGRTRVPLIDYGAGKPVAEWPDNPGEACK